MSFERTEKELLTDELIKQDIVHKFKEESHIVINIILIAFSAFVVFCFSFLTPLAWFFILIPILLLLLWHANRKKILKEIEDNRFVVVLDELLYEKRRELRKEMTFYKGRWTSYLQFLNNGRYELEGNYYVWSDKYEMSATGICNTSIPKDVFYIVLFENSKKIAMVYNRKFFNYFDYKE